MPRDLAAELVVARPGELWTQLRTLLGASVGFVPANFELVVATVLDLPAAAASGIAADRPLLGALLLPEGEEPAFVVAIKLQSGAELVARIATGADAPFAPQPKGGGLTLLSRKKPGGPALGVLGDYLLTAPRPAAIESAGPWLARTLSRRPPPTEAALLSLNEGAFSGPLTSALSRRWQAYQKELRELDRRERDARGRAPDFADPAALIGAGDQSVRAVLDLLGTMKAGRLVMVPSADAVRLDLELEPAPGRFAEKAIAELSVGDLEPLLGLPRTTAAALLLRSSAAERAEAAKDAGLGLEQLLGGRLAEADRERLRKSLAAFHEGRGDTSVYGLLAGRTLFLRSDVSDGAKLERGVIETLRAVELPAIKAPLRELFGDFTVRRSQRTVGGVPAQRIELTPRKPGADAPVVEVLFARQGGHAVTVLGAPAQPALPALLSTAGPESLGGDARVSGLSAPLREGAALTVFADLGLLGLADGALGGAPLFLVVAKRERSARVSLSCSAAALGALVGRLGSR